MRKYINKYAIPFSILITLLSITLTVDSYKKIEESFHSITKSYFRMSVDSRYDIIDLTLHESIKHYLKGIAEITRENLVLGGEDYEKTIFTQIVDLHRIGFEGYIYLMDRDGTLLYHPYIAGQNLSEYPHIQEQLAKPEALIEYQWRNPEDDQAKDKIVYSLRLDNGQVIGISAYKKDLLHLISQKELMSKLNKYQLGESGYLFIVDGNGKLLLHPSREGKNIESLIGISTTEFFERVKIHPEGTFTYELKPEHNGKPVKHFEDNSIVTKDVQYRYYPYLDWIIVSGIERGELLFHSESLFEAAIITIASLGSIILMLVLLLNSRHRQLMGVLKRDYLTGLHNRRSFMEMAVERVDEHNAHQSSFSTLLLDIDFFKSVNDTFGHQQGDVVIKAVAKTIERYEGEHSLCARYGGEEFIMLLTNVDHHEALKIANRIRLDIQAIDGLCRKITVSIGVYTSIGKVSLEQAIIYADNALYEAKDNGRNQVIDYWPEVERKAS